MGNYNPVDSQLIFNAELKKLGLTSRTWTGMSEFKQYVKTKQYGPGPASQLPKISSNIVSPQMAATLAKKKYNVFAPQMPDLITTKFKIRDRVSANITRQGKDSQQSRINQNSNTVSQGLAQATQITSLAGVGSAAMTTGAAAGVSTGMATAAAATAAAGPIAGAAYGAAAGAATATTTAAAAGTTAGAGMGLAAAMGPLAIAAFAIMAISSINSAKAARKASKRAQERERDIYKTKVAMYQNREQLENLVLNDTLNQVERQATKSRATLNVAKGETLGGSTYNMLQLAHRRNELEYKERLKSRNIQKRIAMREQLVVDYHATRVKMESIADQAPSNADIALGIISSGLSTAMSYYSAVGDPNAPETA